MVPAGSVAVADFGEAGREGQIVDPALHQVGCDVDMNVAYPRN
jgi:hypothetical protein